MIRKMYDKVYRALEHNPQLRNSDKLLQLHIWENEGLYFSETQRSQFLKVSSPETIRRTRQKIQEDGYFPASSSTQQYRTELRSEVVSDVVTPKIEGRAIPWLRDE